MTRLQFHRLRTCLWAVQVPPAVWVGGWKPEWERPLFTYLVLISLAALVESAGTDWDQAREGPTTTREDRPVAVRHSNPSVTTSATDITSAIKDKRGFEDITRSVLVTNESAVIVFIGGPDVTITSYGYKLAAGQSMPFDLIENDVLYGIVATGTAPLAVLTTGV